MSRRVFVPRGIYAVGGAIGIVEEGESTPQRAAANWAVLQNNQKNVVERARAGALGTCGTSCLRPETVQSNGLGLQVVYQDAVGMLVDAESAQPGQDLTDVVRVTNTSRYMALEQLALNLLVPDGWEIGGRRLAGEEGATRRAAGISAWKAMPVTGDIPWAATADGTVDRGAPIRELEPRPL